MSADLTCPTDPGSGLHDTVDGQIPRPTVNHDPVNESKTKLGGDSGVEETAIPELLDASPADVLLSGEKGTQDDLEHFRCDAAAWHIIATWLSAWVGTGSRQIDPAVMNSCSGFHVEYNVCLPEASDAYDRPLGEDRQDEIDRWADYMDEAFFGREMRPN